MSQDGSGLEQMPITDFQIGTVIRRSFLVLFKNFGPFILMSLVFMLPSQFQLFLANPAMQALQMLWFRWLRSVCIFCRRACCPPRLSTAPSFNCVAAMPARWSPW